MGSIKSVIMGVVGIVIGLALVPTVWTAVYTDALGGTNPVNGTAASLLKLVPFIYVGAVVIGGIVYAVKG
jgi:hypothetical protein